MSYLAIHVDSSEHLILMPYSSIMIIKHSAKIMIDKNHIIF